MRFYHSVARTAVRRVNDAVRWQGREGAEQCRERGGSSEDGGVTPLKVKYLYYHICSGSFNTVSSLRIPLGIMQMSAPFYKSYTLKVSFFGGEYERTLLFSFGMAAVFHCVFFFFFG